MSSGIGMEINEYEAVQCAPPSEERQRNTYAEIIMLARLGVETLVSHLPLPAQIQHSPSNRYEAEFLRKMFDFRRW